MDKMINIGIIGVGINGLDHCRGLVGYQIAELWP